MTMIKISDNGVSRVWRKGKWIFKQQPKYMADNAWYAYMVMAGSGFVIEDVARMDVETIRLPFLVCERITDVSEFLRQCDLFLETLQERGLRHGDLTRPHVFVIENRPVVIDWGESRVLCDPRPDKRPEGDVYWLHRTVGEILNAN